MQLCEIAKIEAKAPGTIAIEGNYPGLVYFFDHNKERMLIAGRQGYTEMPIAMVRQMIKELPDIIEDRYCFTEREVFRVENKRRKRKCR